jgi:hypothetical protein
MLQLTRPVRSTPLIVASLALVFPTWIAVGWGTQIPGVYGVLSVALGSSFFFLALWVAKLANSRATFVVISIFGVLLGALVLFFTVDSVIQYPQESWETKAVILITCLDVALYLALIRVWRKRRATPGAS